MRTKIVFSFFMITLIMVSNLYACSCCSELHTWKKYKKVVTKKQIQQFSKLLIGGGYLSKISSKGKIATYATVKKVFLNRKNIQIFFTDGSKAILKYQPKVEYFSSNITFLFHEEQNYSPTIKFYKEIRFSGLLNITKNLAKEIPQRNIKATFILRGSGGACLRKSDFKRWTLYLDYKNKENQYIGSGIVYLKERFPKQNGKKIAYLWLREMGVLVSKDLAKVSKLDLHWKSIENPKMIHIQELKNLKELNLGRTNIDDLGISYLKNNLLLESLSVSETKVEGRGFISLQKLPNLKKIEADFSNVSDEFLQKISLLKHVQVLSLFNHKLTGKGLVYLQKLKKLKWLNIRSRKSVIRDMDLVHLSTLTALKGLNLSDLKVGKGIQYLEKLKDLRVLWLGGTLVLDQHLINLSSLTNLRKLELSRTKITDRGVQFLSELKQLKELWLDDTLITNQGLYNLKRLKHISKIYVRNTKVTKKGVLKLKVLLPHVKIFF